MRSSAITPKFIRATSTSRLICSLLAPVLVLLIFPTLGSATHFRYGLMNWRPRPDLAPRTIEFTVTVALRRDGYPGSHPDGFPDIGDSVLETIGATSLAFGDGASTNILRVRVTAIDPRQNFIYGVLHSDPALSTIRHSYADQRNYTARISTCCRISACVSAGGTGGLGNRHINNPGGSYRLETIVNVGTRNTPPTSTLFPIVACRRDEVCSIQIPSEDADGDQIRFRLSTPMEASSGSFRHPGDPGSGAPNRVSVTAGGLFTWDTTGAQRSNNPSCPRTLYSTQIMMEDLDENGAVKSKVPLDFFLFPGGSGNPPVFLPPSPPCDGTIFGTTSDEITFVVTTEDPDSDDSVTLNVVGLPPGATMTPRLPINSAPGEPVSSVFRWMPINAQIGRFVLNFAATDRTNQSLCTVSLEISSCNDAQNGDPQFVTFDTDAEEDEIPQLTDISGSALQDQGIRLEGTSGINGAAGVYTNRTGPSGSGSDDLIPISFPNFITTLADPGNPENSDYGSITIDFVDQLTHLPRPVVLAELFYLDVEDSIGSLTAFAAPGATGNILDVATTANNPSGSQFRIAAGGRLTRLRILSVRADFGNGDDSAAIDQLCYEYSPPQISITDDFDPEQVLEVSPGREFPLTIEVANTTQERFLGTFLLYLVLSPFEPSERQVRLVSSRDFNLPPDAQVSRTRNYVIPEAFGETHMGEQIQLAHYICSRDMVVQSETKETLVLVDVLTAPPR